MGEPRPQRVSTWRTALQLELDENRFREEQDRKSAEKANAEVLRQQEQDEKDAARLTEHRHFVISIVVAVVLSILSIAVSRLDLTATLSLFAG